MKISCETRLGDSPAKIIDLRPTKAICVGRNYSDHAKELGHSPPTEPLIFMKPVSSMIGHGDTILRPKEYERVDHEGELALVIGKRAYQVSKEEALDYVLGYTCANDITIRDLQKSGPWLRAKGMDTFLPLGPRIVSDLNPEDLSIEVRVGGALKQSGRTSQFLFSIAEVLAYITKDICLEPHDIVLTGTPAGVGNLSGGDQVEVSIEGIGTLSNPVKFR